MRREDDERLQRRTQRPIGSDWLRETIGSLLSEAVEAVGLARI